MIKKSISSDQSLRQRAEEKITANKAASLETLSPEETHKLIHELHVHQIELEMQNDELRQNRDELESVLDKYTDLYDFAPVGYFTLDCNGVINAVNLTGARLFGMERSRLINRRFAHFITIETRLSFAAFLENTFSKQAQNSCVVALLKEKKKTLFVQINGMVSNSGQECRITVIDITDQKLTEEALQKSRKFHAETERIGKVGGWEFDIETKEQIWTEEVYRIHEVDLDFKPTVQNGINFYTLDSRPIIEKLLQRAIEHGEPFDAELEIITLKGNLRRVHAIGKIDPDNRRIFGFFQDITERKQAEEALEKSEERLRNIARAGKIGLYEWNASQGTPYWSPETYELLGCQPDSAASFEVWLGCVHPDDREHVTNNLSEMMEQARAGRHGETRRDEYRVKHRDGTVHWLEATTTYDLKGNDLIIRGATLDITRRKQSEDALRASRSLMNSIIEGTTDAVYVKDVQGQYQLFNSAAENITGKQSIDVLGKDDYVLFPPAEAKAVMEGDDKVRDGGVVKTYEEVLTDAEGQINTFLSTKGPIFDDQGEIIGLFGIARNITEIKMIERKLRLSEQKFSTAFHASPDSININRLNDGMYLEINEGFTTITGYTVKDVIGKTSIEINIWVDIQNRTRLVTELNKSGFINNLEAQFRRKNGTILTGIMSARIIEIEGVHCILSITRDISERARAKEQLMELNKKLHDLNEHLLTVQEQERLKIARDIHDELGQNLTILKLDLELIELRIPGDSNELHEYIINMRGRIEEVSAKIQQIASELRPPLLDNAGLTAAIEWHVNEINKRCGLECFIMLNEDADSLDQKTATAVMRIVQEGLTNVIRHSQASEVSVSLCKRDGNLILEISDNGCGITQEQRTSPKAYGLMGMRERANSCCGELKFIVNPESGTTLQLTIPLETGEETE